MKTNLQLKLTQKKYIQIIGIVIGTLFLGVLVGYFVGKGNNPTSESDNLPSNLSKPASNEVNFVFVQDALTADEDTSDFPLLEKKLTTPTLKFRLVVIPKGNKKTNRLNKKTSYTPSAGLLSPSRVALMENSGVKLDVLFVANPEEGNECYSEVQIITSKNSPIKNIEELKNKKMAINVTSFPLTARLFDQKRLILEKVINYSEPNKAIGHLQKGDIEAMALLIQKYEDGKVISPLGEFEDGEYLELEDLKVLTTTDFKVPCKLIFARKEIGGKLKAELKENFLKLLKNPEDVELLRNTLEIHSLRNIKNDEWSRIKFYFSNIPKITP